MAKKVKKPKRRKGTFSDLRLPVSKAYVYPFSRTRMIILGGIAALLLLAYIFISGSDFISNGPLSSNHAAFEDDCASCHTDVSFSNVKAATVADAKCMVCHEKAGRNVPAHSFDGHYLYRSFDKNRIAQVSDAVRSNEKACFTCHGEHQGRDAAITDVSDAQCLTCHDYGSFNSDHPEFAFAVNATPDPANLKFNHVFHVKQVMSGSSIDTTQICLVCHTPQADGRNFEAINFDQHCAKCHLGYTNATGTPPVPLKRSGQAGAVSVRTIRNSRQPGAEWAETANLNEYDEADGDIEKSILFHKDPWILENLKRLRNELFESEGLTDLISTSGDTPRHDSAELYREAVATLTAQLAALKSHPSTDVQEQINEMETELREVERKLKYPQELQLDYGQFRLSEAQLRDAFKQNPQKLSEYQDVVSDLTEACQKCHLVKNAAIVRVQKKQRALLRAEFDHRAHILLNNCTDCHYQIDFEKWLGQKGNPPAEADHAGIQNMPSIATCQSCHSAEKASNHCVTCHQFHPDKSHQSNLLLHVN